MDIEIVSESGHLLYNDNYEELNERILNYLHREGIINLSIENIIDKVNIFNEYQDLIYNDKETLDIKSNDILCDEETDSN